jgi:hypothetical protein
MDLTFVWRNFRSGHGIPGKFEDPNHEQRKVGESIYNSPDGASKRGECVDQYHEKVQAYLGNEIPRKRSSHWIVLILGIMSMRQKESAVAKVSVEAWTESGIWLAMFAHHMTG